MMLSRASKALLLTTMLAALPAGSLAQTTAAPATKVRVLVNATYNTTSRTFDERSMFDAFLEQGSTNRAYDGGAGIGFEVGAIYSITPAFGVMGSVELQSAEHDVSFDISEPHPLLFNRSRTASDERAGLDYKEQALNVDAVYTLESGALVVDVFGGATLFFTETELIDDISTSSSYPFDELAISNAETVKLEENPIGFNVGGALTYRLTSIVGVSFHAKFSRATIELMRDGADTISIDAGGFRIGGGIRLAF